MKTTSIIRPESQTLTNFDYSSAGLLSEAARFRQTCERAIDRAGDEVDSADARAKAAAVHLIGAVANVGLAAGHMTRGTAHAAAGAGHAVAAVGVGAAGVAFGAGEESLSFTSRVLNAAACGLVQLSNAITDMIGDGKTATVREIEGRGRGRLSERLYATSAAELKQSGAQLRIAWASYEHAMGHALGAGVNVGSAAAYGGLAMADLATAMGQIGVAGVAQASELALVFGALGVQAAENGVQGTRDVLLLGARAAAELGRAAATPADSDTAVVAVKRATGVYDAEFRELLRMNPELRRLPAAQRYVAAQPAVR
jgi:hypothetical protein